jgi:hypothetical protein
MLVTTDNPVKSALPVMRGLLPKLMFLSTGARAGAAVKETSKKVVVEPLRATLFMMSPPENVAPSEFNPHALIGLPEFINTFPVQSQAVTVFVEQVGESPFPTPQILAAVLMV